MALKSVVVTGGNAGIGLALCRQLVLEDGCHVFMGSRNLEKGEAAIGSIVADAPQAAARLTLVQIDTASDESVAAAAEVVKAKIGDEGLYGVVNNAGTGLSHGVGPETVINTNLFGPKRMCESFMPMLKPPGRVVNVSSGAGPMYVKACSNLAMKKSLCSPEVTWEQIDVALKGGLADDRMQGYGLSKAALNAYTALLARENPAHVITCCTPGFIDTAIVKGIGAGKRPPEEGTVSIRHCLFGDVTSGWYFGSDAVRSPLHVLRHDGQPPYNGVAPF